MATTIRIRRIKLGGRESIDIRRLHNGKPTRSGISLPPDKIEEIIEKLRNSNGKSEIVEL